MEKKSEVEKKLETGKKNGEKKDKERKAKIPIS